MIPGHVIKRIRSQRGLSMKALAGRIGVSHAAISQWESGAVRCSDDWRDKLAVALEVPPDALRVVDGEEVDAPQPVLTRRLPIYGDVPAGARESWPLPAESIEVLADYAGPSRFVLRVSGDSMEPDVRDGDLIVIDPMSSVSGSSLSTNIEDARTRGPILLVRHQGHPMLKRFTIGPWAAAGRNKGPTPIGPVLMSRNPTHPPIPIKAGDEFEIIGRAVGVAWHPL